VHYRQNIINLSAVLLEIVNILFEIIIENVCFFCIIIILAGHRDNNIYYVQRDYIIIPEIALLNCYGINLGTIRWFIEKMYIILGGIISYEEKAKYSIAGYQNFDCG
jgi:hypothetical protein